MLLLAGEFRSILSRQGSLPLSPVWFRVQLWLCRTVLPRPSSPLFFQSRENYVGQFDNAAFKKYRQCTGRCSRSPDNHQSPHHFACICCEGFTAVPVHRKLSSQSRKSVDSVVKTMVSITYFRLVLFTIS